MDSIARRDRVFINSRHRTDTSQPSNNFSFYCTPPIIGVDRVKLVSCSIPLSASTFQHGENIMVWTTSDGGEVTVTLKTDQVYTLKELETAINEAFYDAGVQCIGVIQTNSTIKFLNSDYRSINLTSAPSQLHLKDLHIPSIIGNPNIFHTTFKWDFDAQVQRSNPEVEYILIQYLDLTTQQPAEQKVFLPVTYDNTTFENAMNQYSSTTGFTFSATGTSPNITIAATPIPQSFFRTIYVTAHAVQGSTLPQDTTFPNISYLTFTDTVGATSTTKTLHIDNGVISIQDLVHSLQANFGDPNTVFTILGTNQAASIRVTCNPHSSTRTVQLRAFDYLGQLTTGNLLNITNTTAIAIPQSGGTATFTTTAQFVEMPSNFLFGLPFNFIQESHSFPAGSSTAATLTTSATIETSGYSYPKTPRQYTITFDQGHQYTDAEIINKLNNVVGAYGGSFSLGTDRVLQLSITNDKFSSQYGNLRFYEFTPLGCTATRDIGAPVTNFRFDAAVPSLTTTAGVASTSVIDLSTRTKVYYLSLPTLYNSSSCGKGHRSIIRQICNHNNSTFGQYLTYQDTSDDFVRIARDNVGQIDVRILNDDMEDVNLNNQDVFIELEFM